jgi:ribonuclease Z
MIENAQDADLLIHEATCSHELIEDRKNHTSARQAAQIADEAGVDRLVLTHLSRRYRNREDELEEEAREVFEDTVVGEDGQRFEIKPHRPESELSSDS